MGFAVDASSVYGTRDEGFEVPSFERYHHFPIVPQLLYKFIILVLPARCHGLANKLVIYRIARLPDNGHRSVCLSRNRPPVRIDMHGKLIQVLENPE